MNRSRSSDRHVAAHCLKALALLGIVGWLLAPGPLLAQVPVPAPQRGGAAPAPAPGGAAGPPTALQVMPQQSGPEQINLEPLGDGPSVEELTALRGQIARIRGMIEYAKMQQEYENLRRPAGPGVPQNANPAPDSGASGTGSRKSIGVKTIVGVRGRLEATLVLPDETEVGVNVGSTLPDGSHITDISKNGVSAEKDGQPFMLGFLPGRRRGGTTLVTGDGLGVPAASRAASAPAPAEAAPATPEQPGQAAQGSTPPAQGQTSGAARPGLGSSGVAVNGQFQAAPAAPR